MKIVLNRQQILTVLSPLMCAVSGKSTVAAAEGILIEAKHPDVCKFTTYDLEKGVSTTATAKVLEEGCYIINAQKMMQTLRVMDGEEVTLSVDDKLCALFTCGKSSHKMIALNGADFPELPYLSNDRGFVMPEGTLREMLSKTMYAMGVNDQRPVLNGCFFEVKNDSILLVSCDSFKLARCKLQTEIQNSNADGSDLSFRFIVPVKTVNDLFKLLSSDKEKNVTIHMTRKHILFHIGELEFFSRLIDGEYIVYDRIIRKDSKIFAIVNRDVLISSLDRAALITEERVMNSVRSHVKLHFEGGLLKILAASSAGSTYDEIEIEHEGSDLLIAFNNRFLIDSVRACDSEYIKMSLSSNLASVNIEPAEGKEEAAEDLFMLLPVRMKE